MLVLSRRKDESVVINNDIRIVVVEIRGDKVRLGVEAPKEVPVHRSEVYEAINHGASGAEMGRTFVRPETEEMCIESRGGGLGGGDRVIASDAPQSSQPDVIHD